MQVIPLEFDTAEIRYAPELANTDTPDKIFDRQWVLSLLDVVLARVRADYADWKGVSCGKGCRNQEQRRLPALWAAGEPPLFSVISVFSGHSSDPGASMIC